jgi:hypothetical protein
MNKIQLSPNERQERQERMIRLLGRLAPSEGYTLSALDGVKFMLKNALVVMPAEDTSRYVTVQ